MGRQSARQLRKQKEEEAVFRISLRKSSVRQTNHRVRCEAGHIRASRFELNAWCKPFVSNRTEVSREEPDDFRTRGRRLARCRNPYASVAFAFYRPSCRGCRHDVARAARGGRRQQAPDREL